MTAERAYNLAIETSGRYGSVSLGRGDELLGGVKLPPPERHRVDLMLAVDQVCRTHGVKPGDLGEVYLSIGPGSFTGLRIGVSTAKMLASALGVKLVAVPSVEVVARNAPAPDPVAAAARADSERTLTPALSLRERGPELAVCLNMKRGSVYAGLFAFGSEDWQLTAPAALLSLREVLERTPRPLAVISEVQEQWRQQPAELLQGVTLLPEELAVGRSEVVWRLGRAAARRGEYIDPLKLLPLYVRVPEAEELWAKRHT